MAERIHLINPRLARELINAETITQTEHAIAAIQRTLDRAKWRPVGDIEYNHGPAQIGIDPSTQLIERIINAQEACIELEAQQRNISPSTPLEAARTFFQVPQGGLGTMRDDGIRKLAERTVSVTVAESGTKAPTVIIEDRGIGQHPLKFASTFLGLHLSDKPNKPYLIGQYGQGGASTLLHSTYTIFASRRAPKLALRGQEDLVGIAVVRFRAGAVRGGTYEYLTNGGAILAVRASEAPAPFRSASGTRVTHIAYNLHGFTGAYRRHRTGLWALINAALFDPILPIHMKGTRKIDTTGDKGATTTGRIAKGNVAVLNGLPEKPLGDGAPMNDDDADDDDDRLDGESGLRRRRGSAYLAFRDDTHTCRVKDEDGDYGTVRFNIWVLGGTDTTDTYIRADQAVTITLAGQRHGKESREFLKGCKLGFLSKRMIVQIEADGLTTEAKRQAFPSGREQQRNTPITNLIFKELTQYLENHERIRELEAEARAQALANASSKAKDSVRKKVAKLMQRYLAGTGGALGRASGTEALSQVGGPAGRTPGLQHRPPKQRPPKPPPDDSSLQAIPTQMEIANSELILSVGATTHAILSINAKNGYLADHGDDLRVEITPTDSNDDLLSSGPSKISTGGGPTGTGCGGNGTGDGKGGGGGRGGHGIYVKGMGSLRGGVARLVLGSDPTAVPGMYAIRVSLATPGPTGALVAVGTVEVVPAEAVPGGQDLAEGGTPDIRWFTHPDDARSDEEREELQEHWPSEWDKSVVIGDVEESSSFIVFRLNRSYPDLKHAINRRASSAKGSENAVESLTDRYAAMVTFGMWLLHDQKKKDTQKWPLDVFQAACAALARSTLATMLDSDIEEDLTSSAP